MPDGRRDALVAVLSEEVARTVAQRADWTPGDVVRAVLASGFVVARAEVVAKADVRTLADSLDAEETDGDAWLTLTVARLRALAEDDT